MADLVIRGAYIKKVIQKKAFAEMGNPNDEFVDRDLFLFATKLDGMAIG